MTVAPTTLAPTPSPRADAAVATAPGNPAFAALLERLAKLAPAAAAPTPAVATTDELQAAVRAADASFASAMDLRRQLEDAFRRHAPTP